jgi:hypothetical protein
MKKLLLLIILLTSSIMVVAKADSTHHLNRGILLPETNSYQIHLTIHEACNWYGATVGSWISFSCLLPELGSKSVCFIGTIIEVGCTANGLVQSIRFETSDDAVLKVGTVTVTKIIKNVSPIYVEAIIIGAEKAKAIWDVADFVNRKSPD